jgi:predicted acyl esterase
MIPRPRWLAPVLLLLGAAGPAPARAAPASPPGARQLGADHTATGVFTGAGVQPAGLRCDAPADASTPRTCEGFLASFDGTLLETTVRVPRTSGVHPLVVAMHGWGGSRASTAKYDAPLLAAGYDVLRYSARGFGGSFGQTNLADVNVEGADLRSLVGQVVDDARLAADASAVAVFGASYGGAHAWLGAVEPAFASPGGKQVAIRTVVPVAGFTDLLDALVPNGRPEQAQDVAGAEKLSYVEALFFGGIRTRLDRAYPNYPDFLFRWNADMTTNELPYATTPSGREVADGLQGYRSAYWQAPFWARVRANAAAGAPQLPILAIQGFTDDLFPMREAVRMVEALRAVDPSYPIALYLGDLGHPRAVNKAGEVAYALDRVLAWLGWYLAGRGTQPAFDVQAAITRRAAMPFSAADVIRVPTLAELSNAGVTARFSHVQLITFDPLNLSGFQWDPLVLAACGQLEPCPSAPASLDVAGDVAAYEVPVSRFSAGSLLVAGGPTVTVWAATASHRIQLDVRVIDVAPDGARSLVTRGTFTVDTGSAARPIGLRRVTIPTHGNLWEVPAGDTLRFEVTNVDLPYLRPSLVPSATLLLNVEVNVPVRR